MVSAPDSLVGEMTIIRAVSGPVCPPSATMDSCFTARQYSIGDEPGRSEGINQLVEYYKSSILLS